MSLLLAGWTAGGLPVQSQLLQLGQVQLELLAQTRAQRQRLIRAEGDAAFQTRALDGLAGRDVYLVFVESYGVAAIDDARYASVLRPRLSEWQAPLSASGLSVVSGRLEAPIRGGQSWLSHATLLSGLPIDNQIWYRSLLERDIGLLSEDFRASGHTAVNVVPAITRDWPEGRELGFDRIYAAPDLNYAGPSLGWVTMPDEFTLHVLGEEIRPAIDGAVYAQVALISSHWPWQPILSLSESPESIGRGEVYDRWAGQGRMSVAEQFDLDRLRDDYVGSVAYSLDAAFDWARRRLPEDALMIVLGDHQPVSLVTGRGASAAVPVHVISGDPALLRTFRRRGFRAGLLPPEGPASDSLAQLRHWLRADFATQSP